MKILLTGHEGYVGSYLKEYMSENHDVRAFEGDLHDVEWHHLDHKYDVVLHLAGIASVKESFNNPEYYYKHNVDLTRKIFKYCQRTGTDVVYASTSNAYEWWLNPYAVTKQMTEEMASMLTVKNIGMRFHTVYPGRSDMLFEKLKAGNVKYINKDHYRDWIHVEDLAPAICTILKYRDKIDEPVLDIGTGYSTPVAELAKLFGFDGEWRSGEVEGERTVTRANVDTLLKLGWTPKRNILNETSNPE